MHAKKYGMMKKALVATLALLASAAFAPPAPMGGGGPIMVHPIVRPTSTPIVFPRPSIAPSTSPRPGVSATPSPVYYANRLRIVYGTIASIRMKTELVVRLRSGYPQRVDATRAIRTGRYSAPLFVGKIVAVMGRMQPSGIIDAMAVTRMPKLDLRTQPDRWIQLQTPRP
jgi:hypothetical protein